MSLYQKHLFFCTNLKDPGKKCCADSNASEISAYTKSRLKQLGLHGGGQIRVSTSGCLGRCRRGPCLVIYPDNIWFTYNNEQDIDEIIQSYLIDGKPVERLLIE